MTIKINTAIELGWRVKDSISGFQGIATAFARFINGCERIEITPEQMKDGKLLDTHYFDAQQLVVIDTNPARNVKPENQPTATDAPGGPHSTPTVAKDPT